MPAVSMRTMETQLASDKWPVEFITVLLTLFAAGSLATATIGQYAVVAFDMRRRARDFGLRMALGASSLQILGSIVREGLRLTAAGLAVGFALSLAVGIGLRGILYGITPTDTGLISVCSASWLPPPCLRATCRLDERRESIRCRRSDRSKNVRPDGPRQA